MEHQLHDPLWASLLQPWTGQLRRRGNYPVQLIINLTKLSDIFWNFMVYPFFTFKGVQRHFNDFTQNQLVWGLHRFGGFVFIIFYFWLHSFYFINVHFTPGINPRMVLANKVDLVIFLFHKCCTLPPTPPVVLDVLWHLWRAALSPHPESSGGALRHFAKEHSPFRPFRCGGLWISSIN